MHGVELVDLNESVKSAHLYNLVCIYTEKGIALNDINENRIEFFIADPSTLDCPDNVFYEFKGTTFNSIGRICD